MSTSSGVVATETQPDAPAAPPARQARGRGDRLAGAARRFGPALGLYAVVKSVGFAVFMYLLHFSGDYRTHSPGMGSGRRPWEVVGSWDGAWYQDLAARWYHPQVLEAGAQASDVRPNSAAFFPLYSGLMRLLSKVTGLGPYGSGMAVSVVFSFVAAAGIYATVSLLLSARMSEQAARRAAVATVGLWALAPGSGVEWAVYTESLFVAIVGWTCYHVMKRNWVAAGLLALVSGLNRPTAAALIAGVGLAALIALLRRTDGIARPLFAILVPPWGLIGYILWVGHRMHNIGGYFLIQKSWNHYFDGGRFTLRAIREIMIGRHHYLWAWPVSDMFALLVLLTVPALLVMMFRQRPPAFLVVFVLLTIASTVLSQQLFCNIPRYLLPAFPLLVAPGLAVSRLKWPTMVALLVFAGAASGWYAGYLTFELGTP
ncbi:hypothetical protein ACIQF6_05270 [Kitasatospora sp. NPDC092948]|uniref:hypothetical protein n=1 Tax=Kitasatospora sp. NPDC092948 TaxID=3364088 RepID=UPI0037F60D2D